ncbi:hypothetical protein MD484_g3751, partial [Candolleomyces efflorescens]
MIPPLPEDTLQEIIKVLSSDSDIQSLCSFALSSRLLAQDCRPYIFRTVDLGESPRFESRYNKLRDVLKENPSLAGHTRELHFFAGHWPDESAKEAPWEPGYAQFLGCFDRVEKLSITDFNLARGDQNGLEEGLKKLLQRESLKTLSFVECHFSLSLLDHAKQVTDFGMDKTRPWIPEQAPPVNEAQERPLTRRPIALSLKEVEGWEVEAWTGLVVDRKGIFKSRWIDKLLLAPKYEQNPMVNVIEPCVELLQALEASKEGTECLSNFTLKTNPAGGLIDKKGPEGEVRRWFPSLAETGRLVVELTVVGG